MTAVAPTAAAPTAAPGRSPLPVLFIGGMGRSGSTLLERLLGQLPGVVAVGELVHLQQRGMIDDEACGCGRPFADCGFWSEVGRRAFGGWERVADWRALQHRVDRKRYTLALALPLLPRYRRDLRRHADRLAAVYRSVAEVAGARVVVDSSKHASTAMLLHHVPGIRPVVVHLVRDSRGVAYSWSRQVVRPETPDGELMVRYGPWSAAEQYVQHNLVFDLLRLVGTPRELVRYEDVVADPGGTLRRILAGAGLPDPGDEGLAFIGRERDGAAVVDLAADHSVAGNPMRFRTGEVALRRDDRWRREMPAPARRLVTAVTAPLLLRYRYLGSSGALGSSGTLGSSGALGSSGELGSRR